MIPDFAVPVVELAFALLAEPSVSKEETGLADQIEQIWRKPEYAHLKVHRSGNAIVARTELGREKRVLVAGHLDTVPFKNNRTPKLIERHGEKYLWGRGSVDMKGGVACLLHASARLKNPKYDVTWVVYDCEEIEDRFNGLKRLLAQTPKLMQADLAIIGEPTSAQIEAGCNGTLRVLATTRGKTAHSARSWMGENAIHLAAQILQRLADYQPQTIQIDGLGYREGLNATWISGGVAKNSIPDQCTVTINYRFAPSKTGEEALAHVKEVLAGIKCELVVDDLAVGALPGMSSKLGEELKQILQAEVFPKYGWTDVARFRAIEVPALNFGPGNPLECHTDQEACAVKEIELVAQKVIEFLG